MANNNNNYKRHNETVYYLDYILQYKQVYVQNKSLKHPYCHLFE